MAWNVDWGLAQTPDIVGNAIKYSAAGRADQLARQKLTTQNKAAAQYGSGDAAGARRTALAGGQVDLAADFDKLSEGDRERAAATVSGVADILAGVKGLPYEQRKAAILARKPDLLKIGYQPQKIDTFDPTDANINERLDEALGYKGTLERADAKRKFDADQAQRAFDNAQPKYTPVVPGGKVVPIYPVDPATGQPMHPATPEPAPAGGPAMGATPAPTPASASPGGSNLPRSVRNKNPGNLKDGPFARGLPGYVGADADGFAIYDTDENGANASVGLLKGYGTRGLNTVTGIINRWAPPSDSNPTPAYVDFVAREVGVGANQPLDMTDPLTLSDIAMAIRKFEGGPATPSNARPAAPQPGGGVAGPVAAARPGDPPGTIYGDPKPDPGAVTPPPGAGLTPLGGNFFQDRVGRIYQPNSAGVLTQTIGIGDAEVKASVGNITGLNNVMSAVDRYKTAIKGLGPKDFGPAGKYVGDPTRYAEAKGAATDLMMTLKGPAVYNLGVITGPDLDILQGVVADPAKFDTVLRQGQILPGVGQLEKSLRSKFEAERESFRVLGGTVDALPKMYQPATKAPEAGPKPPAGRKGGDGFYYHEDPTKKGSFAQVRQAPDGKWYLRAGNGQFYEVK